MISLSPKQPFTCKFVQRSLQNNYNHETKKLELENLEIKGSQYELKLLKLKRIVIITSETFVKSNL